jgi:hypothetical protein
VERDKGRNGFGKALQKETRGSTTALVALQTIETGFDSAIGVSEGRQAGEADAELRGLSASGKHERLFRDGINFDDLPTWRKRGTGLYWEEYDRPGVNPVIGEPTTARRRRIGRDLELPVRDAYSAFLRRLMRLSGRVRGSVARQSGT